MVDSISQTGEMKKEIEEKLKEVILSFGKDFIAGLTAAQASGKSTVQNSVNA